MNATNHNQLLGMLRRRDAIACYNEKLHAFQQQANDVGTDQFPREFGVSEVGASKRCVEPIKKVCFMAIAVIQFAAAAAIIIVAGVFLSRFADEIAERTGFGRLLIGSILLAGATSLPELSVDVSAVRKGMADLELGDLMGSSLFNLLILAILDLSSRCESRGRIGR